MSININRQPRSILKKIIIPIVDLELASNIKEVDIVFKDLLNQPEISSDNKTKEEENNQPNKDNTKSILEVISLLKSKNKSRLKDTKNKVYISNPKL